IKGNFVPETLLTADGANVSSNPDPASGPVTFWRIATVRDGRRTYDDGYYAVEPIAALITAGKEAVEFVNGECYYPVWLAYEGSGNENKYTVKRNSYYKITITSVTGAGGVDDDDDIIDPEVPLDRQVTIGVNIKVTNWDDIDQEAGI
ncbi:MAG: fimbria major subunit, partial [Rikenellaceae bacterium]|nr:fimbria major subunit [Rikenellaceae bacterium]